jgi:hypothetical protein
MFDRRTVPAGRVALVTAIAFDRDALARTVGGGIGLSSGTAARPATDHRGKQRNKGDA